MYRNSLCVSLIVFIKFNMYYMKLPRWFYRCFPGDLLSSHRHLRLRPVEQREAYTNSPIMKISLRFTGDEFFSRFYFFFFPVLLRNKQLSKKGKGRRGFSLFLIHSFLTVIQFWKGCLQWSAKRQHLLRNIYSATFSTPPRFLRPPIPN